MLGCHEFCGYYEWTFHFVRRTWGQAAVARLWAEAIGGESQAHYAEAGRQAGLAGLYQTWVKTGQDEACDWVFNLDEARNVLRWDMRQCPSKGFLLAHGLNADEDYCDHCMGWMIPLLTEIGVEVAVHEHNHQGQCWGIMRAVNRPSEPLPAQGDIRQDPRWRVGYLDRWQDNRKLPLAPGASDDGDPCAIFAAWFAGVERLAVVCDEPLPGLAPEAPQRTGGLLSARAYVRGGDWGLSPAAVLLGHDAADLPAVAERYRQTPEPVRPLLVHPYLPGHAVLDFLAAGLPRPFPLLPLLIRSGQYVHQPGAPEPSAASLLAALARALERE